MQQFCLRQMPTHDHEVSLLKRSTRRNQLAELDSAQELFGKPAVARSFCLLMEWSFDYLCGQKLACCLIPGGGQFAGVKVSYSLYYCIFSCSYLLTVPYVFPISRYLGNLYLLSTSGSRLQRPDSLESRQQPWIRASKEDPDRLC